MKTQLEVLKQTAKAIKCLDAIGFANQSLEDKKRLQSARAKMINVIFENGYELQQSSYRLIKSKVARELLQEAV
jgi:hypothetical protein